MINQSTPSINCGQDKYKWEVDYTDPGACASGACQFDYQFIPNTPAHSNF